MRPVTTAWIAMIVALSACAPETPTTSLLPEAQPGVAAFSHFAYQGRDADLATPPAEGEFLNPILPGFYPDPSITQVGTDYYLVNSTFAYFPGIPVFHSTDLVNWNQIGNAIDRPGMLNFDNLGLSRGVFAPTIEHHDGVFYISNTCVDCGGNFILTAADPKGPWSDPVWLPQVGGIDPSLFFEEDGTVWIMNNDEPPGGSTYPGHRAVWMRQIDPVTFQSISEPFVIINGGVRPEEKPIWIEGPHIYKIGGRYYFSAAEGGTAVGHSQVILRSDSLTGPYIPWERNPILTQRDLPEGREFPVTSVGHADLVQDGAGNWWASFLGVRPYEGDFYNTGRETFLLPVNWTEDGWPVILERGAALPRRLARPQFPGAVPVSAPDPNAPVRHEFHAGPLTPDWLFIRVPDAQWWSLDQGELLLQAQSSGLGDGGQPAFVGQRQKHREAVAETALARLPAAGTEAGLSVLQSDEFWYSLGLVREASGGTLARLTVRAGPDDPATGRVIAETPLAEVSGPVGLRITARNAAYDFEVSTVDGQWTSVAKDQDGYILSTRTAGGFVGAVFGLYAVTTPVATP